jgi:hypothetical protein
MAKGQRFTTLKIHGAAPVIVGFLVETYAGFVPGYSKI